MRGKMAKPSKPIAIRATDILPKSRVSIYPEPFASRMTGREKRQLGDFFGLKNFGVNLTRLAPNGISALRHSHSRQDELIYILQGKPTLQDNDAKIQLEPGMCAGFPAGENNACNLINETEEDVIYLEIGDRTPGDEVIYPDDDLLAKEVQGLWIFTHKDGTPY